MAFQGFLRQSTAVDILLGPFLDDTDGKTAETGLTLSQADIKLSKNGQALAQKNDDTAAAHDANGYYNCELDATDTNTVGQLTIICHESGALPVRLDYHVVEEAVYDAMYGASAAGPLDAAGIRTAVGLADADLDTQLGAIPTVEELAAAVTGGDTYTAIIKHTTNDTGHGDTWIVEWFKNGEPITSGITSPTLTVTKLSDSSVLLNAVTPTQVSGTHLWRYTTTASRIVGGADYNAVCSATIDSATRTGGGVLGRDG